MTEKLGQVIAEWNERTNDYRLYPEEFPNWTIAYVDKIDEEVYLRITAFGYEGLKVVGAPEEKVDKKQFINMGIVFAIAVAAAAAVFGWLCEVGAI